MKNSNNELIISRILHAGYLFEDSEDRILFDPIFENPFSVNCYAFPAIKFLTEKLSQQKFSAVFISHYHEDHCSFESLNFLDRNTPIYMFCIYTEMFELLKDLGFHNAHSLELNKEITIGNFKIKTLPALDRDVDCIFHINYLNLNILNVVDSWIDDLTFTKSIEQNIWDLVLWPFQTMRELQVLSPMRQGSAIVEIPPEWIDQLSKMNIRILVPSSCQFKMEDWSWYNKSFFPISYQYFYEIISTISSLKRTQVYRFEPGGRVKLSESSFEEISPIDWIQVLDSKESDYEFIADNVPSSMEFIANHLAHPTEYELQKTLNFCNIEICKQWTNLVPEDYFSKSRLWQLKLYGPNGTSFSFLYEIHASSIRMVFESELQVSWLTEIPLVKVYAALEAGESLTSIYIRINNTIFDSLTESELQNVDLLEDPLLRILYNGQFASYQKAQLKRIKLN
ncbi:MAG: MBL fold metallo-hydrolase [Bdellovibrionales bacterium]|nr:MBL fold metallo-hydrolase [Bdellovibrionales bacterium]